MLFFPSHHGHCNATEVKVLPKNLHFFSIFTQLGPINDLLENYTGSLTEYALLFQISGTGIKWVQAQMDRNGTFLSVIPLEKSLF